MKLAKNINEANCITHSGTMHTDEIFATAFLDMYIGEVVVARVPKVPEEIDKNRVLVYDIGYGKYDHHQKDAEKRSNGITYCAFGLLWRDFGKAFLETKNIQYIDEVFEIVDKDLVEGIDADDNGIFPKIEAAYKVKTISDTFKLFNPGYKSNKNPDQQFKKAVEFAKEILEEEINNANGKAMAKVKIEEKLKEVKNHVLILDEYMPYEQVLLNNDLGKEVYLVIFPSNRGGYMLKTVPKSTEDHTKRVDFPKEWHSLEGENLEKVSGIKGLTFCHTTGFITACDKLETALKVVDRVIPSEDK